MYKIKAIENDNKNILVNGVVRPAVFIATAIGDLVRITSMKRLVPGISSQGVHYSKIEINDEACESANDAVQKLNAFIGSFKSGGGGVSPIIIVPDYNHISDNKLPDSSGGTWTVDIDGWVNVQILILNNGDESKSSNVLCRINGK
ncbi:MAG: hypothetical protein LBC68_03095, partial [Prevotellaceae bacterium]|nr:hypothetical protein [Prevotellaceae bacterium]